MRKQLTSKISIIAATALTLGTCLPAGIAFADPDPETPPTPPYVGNQSGAGSTALTMVWEDADTEYMGTEEPGTNNPDTTPHDGLGDNLAFKAPTAINFVAKANGTLLAPQSQYIHIDNLSAYGIRVSSMKVDENTGWNIVENASAAANKSNAVWGTIGPSGDTLNWGAYTTKNDVATQYLWNMAAAGANENADKVYLTVSGNVANLNQDLSSAKTFGTIHWYLKAGNVEVVVPTKTSLDSYTMNELKFISEDIRQNGNTSRYYDTFSSFAMAGANVSVTLHDETTTKNATLVDASSDYGLVFMLDEITTAPMNTSNTSYSGWTDSDMRSSLRPGGSIYQNCLDGMTMELADRKVVVPHEVTTYAANRNAAGPATTDTFFLPSIKEIHGPTATSYANNSWTYGGYYESQGHPQFLYFDNLGAHGNSYSVLSRANGFSKAPSGSWWLRSVYSYSYKYFWVTAANGCPDGIEAGENHAVLPCFCL